jgi:ABC-type antimicrobial peptide transport system permease subunit
MAFPPLLAALRWRLGASLSLLAVAVLAVFTAAAGPLFLGAADTDVLHSTLTDTGFLQTQINAGNVLGAEINPESVFRLPQVARQVGLSRWYGPGVISQDVGVSVPDPALSAKAAAGDLVSRAGICSHLDFISGHCPTSAFQVAMSQRDTQLLGVKLGQKLRTSQGMVTITGIIGVANENASYWMGDAYFSYAIHGGYTPPDLDAFFTPSSTMSGLKVIATAQFPMLVKRTQPSTVPALTSTIKTFEYDVRNRFALGASSRVFVVIDSYLAEASEIVSIVGVVALQLLLLTLFVLYVLVARTAAARRGEVALARLRGATLPSVLAIGLAEPVVILVAALPIGLVLAWLGMKVASRVALSNAPVPFSLLTLLAGLAAFVSGLVAVGAGSRKLLTRRLVDEIRVTEDTSSPLARAAWEGAAIALAGAGLLELATAGVLNGSHPNPIALFAPGLIAVGVAVPGVRLLPLAGALVVRRTRYSRHVETGLAVRQVIRRPAVLRQVLILTVAVALAAFAVIGWSVAGTNRSLRADFDVGAAKVVQVTFPSSVNLITAVQRADPSGRYAMAAMETKQYNQDLLAVDPTRLAKVAYWPAGVSQTSLAQIVRWLQPKLKPALILTGTATRMTVNLDTAVNPPPDLQFTMLDSSGNAQVADFGYLAAGTHTYTASLPSACVAGCYVTSLAPIWYPGQVASASVSYTLFVSALQVERGSQWRSIANRVYQPSYWVSNSRNATIFGEGNTLAVSLYNSAKQDVSPAIMPGQLPGQLRAVSTVDSQPTDPTHNSIQDFDGTSLNVNTSPDVVALPNLGSLGSLISMPLAMRADRGTPVDTTYSVWLAPGAPKRVMKSLVSQGIHVDSVQTPAATLTKFNDGGLGLAYRFFVFAAGAAALLAVATTILTFFLNARRRAFELAVLRALGVPTKTLQRSLIAEQALVLVPGLLLGIVAALIAALVALAAVPEFGSNSGQPPLQLALPALPLLALAVALLVVLSLAAVVAALITVRGVDLARLRLEVR